MNGPDLTGFVGRRVVVLAEPARRVAVVAKDAADRRVVYADDAVVAGESRGLLGDHAEAHRVVVAARDQRRPRRRAERRREDAVVAQAVLRNAVHRGRRNDAAERARHAEAGVIGHDEQYVRRILGRHDPRRPPLFRLHRVVLDHATEFRCGRRELLTIDGCCCTGRSKRAGYFLRKRRRESRQRQNGQQPKQEMCL